MGCGFKPHQTTKTTCGFMWLEGHDPFKPHTPHLPMGMWLCGWSGCGLPQVGHRKHSPPRDVRRRSQR